jgi:hypothetical protein
MQGTFFGTGAPFGSVGQPTAWSGPSFGAQGVSPLGPQGREPVRRASRAATARAAVAVRSTAAAKAAAARISSAAAAPAAAAPASGDPAAAATTFIKPSSTLPQQIQQYQQLGTAGHAAINPFQSTGVPFGATPQLWSQGLSLRPVK